jgi:hypothetical protein
VSRPWGTKVASAARRAGGRGKGGNRRVGVSRTSWTRRIAQWSASSAAAWPAAESAIRRASTRHFGSAIGTQSGSVVPTGFAASGAKATHRVVPLWAREPAHEGGALTLGPPTRSERLTGQAARHGRRSYGHHAYARMRTCTRSA